MPDNITLTCVRPALDQTIVATIPEQLVQLLDWIAANVKQPDGTPKYLYGLNVLWQDAISILLPIWRQLYADGQLATQRQQVNLTVNQLVAEGLANLTVVGP